MYQKVVYEQEVEAFLFFSNMSKSQAEDMVQEAKQKFESMFKDVRVIISSYDDITGETNVDILYTIPNLTCTYIAATRWDPEEIDDEGYELDEVVGDIKEVFNNYIIDDYDITIHNLIPDPSED